MSKEQNKPANPHMGYSVFVTEDTHVVDAMASLQEAKTYLLNKIKASNANNKNKTQLSNMVLKAKNKETLMFGIMNAILAHPSEGLKTV